MGDGSEGGEGVMLWCYICKKLHLWWNAGAGCSAKPSEDSTANDAVPSKYPGPWRWAVAVKETRA